MAEEFIAGKKNGKRDLFNNKLFVFFASLCCSLVIWCVISIYETPETTRVFQDVKVQMSLADTVPGAADMSVFGTNEFYCDVTVKGKSYLVNDTSFNADKIIIRPKLEDIRSPGVYEVQLDARLLNASNELSVVSVEPERITVYFDKKVEKNFTLIPVIDENYTMAENCKLDSMKMSKTEVTVAGPSLEMSQISEVRALAAFTEPISRTVNHPVTFEYLTDGAAVTYSSVVAAQNEIYLDVQVSMKKTFRMTVDVLNIPSGIKVEDILSYTFADYDGNITLSVPTESETLMNSDSVCVGRIDISDFDFTKKQTLQVERYNRSVFYDVLPEKIDVIFTLDTSALTEKTVNVPVLYEKEKVPNVTVQESLQLHLLMSEAAGETFSADGITVQVDTDRLLNLKDAGEYQIPVTVLFDQDMTNVWVQGDAVVTVTVGG